jgi:putative colanic acid biosynthesis acetyltransferase WcaF
MNLSSYSNMDFRRGRPIVYEMLWLLIQATLVNTFLPGTWWRVHLLRIFGAKIGSSPVIKPYLKVKFPWRLSLGDNVWLGEGVWIDNLANVEIHNDVCISQGVYICTGSHNWKSDEFSLITKKIEIQSGSWIAAMCAIGPGVVVESGAILTLSSVATTRLKANNIYTGNPAAAIKKRY